MKTNLDNQKMRPPKYWCQLASAALTCLIVLSTPNGQATVQAPPGIGLPGLDTQSIQAPLPIEDSSNSALSKAAAMMGDSPLTPVPELTDEQFSQVDAGGSATCGILKRSRKLMCWGLNSFGQASPPIGRYKSVSMGEDHGCAVTTARKMICWGLPTASPGPDQAKGRYLSVAAGDDHTCARKIDETIECWGNNENGELNAPEGKFQQVVARGDHSCGVTRSREVMCWGDKSFTNYSKTITSPVKKVATGQLHACVLKTDGLAVCWGNGIYGEANPPADHFVDIVAGDWHTCGLRKDHTALCWGRNQYGQTHIGSDHYRMIAAGGMQSCGIIRGNRRLTCHGSFANNEVWYPNDTHATTTAYEQDGTVRTQLAFLAIFQGVSGLLASGIVNTGKMVDQKMEKWEGRMVPVQLLALVANMFIGWGKEDPNAKIFNILKEIQADIRKLQKGLDEIKNQLNRTELAVLTSWCDNRLEPYANAFNLLAGDAYGENTGAASAYRQLLNQEAIVITNAVDPLSKTPLLFPTGELEKFRSHYLAKLKSARSLLATSLIGANTLQTPALKACFEQGYAEWKGNIANGNSYPFDDRGIYEKAVKVLRAGIIIQGEILQMEQDIEMHAVYTKLVEPRPGSDVPINFNPSDHMLGFCLYADERKIASHPEYSPRWVDVAAICQTNRDRIQNAYIDMVKQMEFVGSPYSDDEVVLSLTTTQMGLSSKGDKNWLWLRNVPDEDWALKKADMHGSVTGKWEDFHARQDSSPFIWSPPFDKGTDAGAYYRNEGVMNAEYSERSYGNGVWHSNGAAWNDIFKIRNAVREKYGKQGEKEDLLAGMVALEDLTQEACKRDKNSQCERKPIGNNQYENVKGPRPKLFNGLSHKPFWMAGNYYNFNYLSKIYFNSSKYQPGENSAEMNCFVAEDINKNGWYMTSPDRYGVKKNLTLSGKVCSTEEMAAMTVATDGGGWVKGVDCDGYHYCFGIGVGPMETEVYKNHYKETLGWFFGNVKWTSSTWEWRDTQWGDFIPRRGGIKKGNFYHMPVVDISERKCKTKMTGSGRREPFRIAGGVQLPSICGEDMDRLIKQSIPRPEYPPVPESLVRLPE